VPSGAAATLYLRNTGTDPVSVTLEGSSAQTIELPADGVETVALRAGGHRLRTDGAVHAAIGMLGDGAIAGWPLWAPPATQKPIVVRP
jgi:hypothetical protein